MEIENGVARDLAGSLSGVANFGLWQDEAASQAEVLIIIGRQ
jgi:hypothetical protein